MFWLIFVGLVMFFYLGNMLINVMDKLRMRMDEIQVAMYRIRDELAEMNKASKNSN